MGFFDLVEFLGPCVDDGLITRDAAGQILAAGAPRGMSVQTARRYLDQHRTARADHAEQHRELRALMNALAAVDVAGTPEEKAEAELMVRVELAVQSRVRSRRAAWRLLTEMNRTDEEDR